MIRICVKMGPPRSKEWSCCFGLHVRTATIMIGLWHLFLNVLALGILAAIIRNPDMIHELESGYDDYGNKVMEPDAPALPTPLSKIDPPYAYRDHSLNYHNVDMGGIVCVCMIAISLMLVYGAAKYKPSHLLPFFCLQLFDFAITTLSAAGYLCYLRSIHRIIADSHRLPWRDELLQLSPQRLSIVVLLVFVSVVLVKAYAIGIVWRCYKYLTIRQHNLRSMLPYIIPDMTARQERDYNTLLPDYEEAIAQSMKQPPPPTYQMAMAYSMGNTHAPGLQVNLENAPTTSVNDHQPINVTVNAIVSDSPADANERSETPAHNASEPPAPQSETAPGPSADAEPHPRDEAAVKPYYNY